MADELADGTYVARNGAFPTYSLNSSGATDANGANVWCYPFDNTDAAFVTIWTRSDGTRQIVFPATGKSLDIYANDYYMGANVQQWEDNDSKAQQWTITPAPSKTYTFDGKDYRGYHIYLTETLNSEKYCIELSGTPTHTDDNDHPNVVITPAEYVDGTDDANADDRYWFFVPANPVPIGTYRIRPAVNFDLVLDVNGNNQNAGANVMINTANGGNNQVWLVTNYDSSGRSRIVATHSFQLMEIANLKKDPDTGKWISYNGYTFGNGSLVCQSTDDGGVDQWWVIVPDGYGTWNGNHIPLYTIHNAASEGTSHLLDVYGGKSYPGNYLQVWEQNGTAAQKFFFEPWVMLDKNLGTPSGIGLSSSASSGARSKIYVTSSTTDISGKLHCLWNCQGKTFKARYRCRSRSVGAASYGSWGRWYSMADNSSANNGLGEIWKPNVTLDDIQQKHSPAILSKIPTVDNSIYDGVQVECEIQRFDETWSGVAPDNKELTVPGLSAHGEVVSKTVDILWQTTLTIGELGWTPDGLLIKYSSDYKHGGNSIKLQWIYDETLKRYIAHPKSENNGIYTWTGMDHSGQLTLPQSYLDWPPVDGDKLTVKMTLVSDNGAQSTSSGTNSVSFNESHDISIGSEYHMDAGYLSIECTKYSGGTTAWIGYQNTYDRYGDPGKYVYEKLAEEATSAGAKRKFIAYPPIGVPFTIFLYTRKSDDVWATERKEFAGLSYSGVEPAAVWNWRDKDTRRLMTAAIYLNVDEIPNLSDERSLEYTTYKTVGRDRPQYYVGKAVERKLDAKGIIFVEGLGYPNLAGATDAQLQELLRVSHALYRSYRGVRAYVTVTGLNVSQSKLEYKEVTVSQYEDGDPTGVF